MMRYVLLLASVVLIIALVVWIVAGIVQFCKNGKPNFIGLGMLLGPAILFALFASATLPGLNEPYEGI